MRETYQSEPVTQMRVTRELGDEVRSDTQHDDRRDPVQSMRGEDERTMRGILGTGTRSTVIVCGVSASHFECVDGVVVA